MVTTTMTPAAMTLGIVLLLGCATGRSQQAQGQPEQDRMQGMQMMQQCRMQCEAAADAADQAMRALAEAERSDDPDQLRSGLRQAQEVLGGMKDRMSRCTSMMGMMQGQMASGEMCPMCGRAMGDGEQAGGDPELATLPARVAQSLEALLEDYLTIGDRLGADTSEGTRGPAQEIADGAAALTRNEIPGHPAFWQQQSAHTNAIRDQAAALATAGGTTAAREHYAKLSAALTRLLLATGVPPGVERGVERLSCPMYPKDRGGAVWLQRPGEVRNPYMGTAMLACFGDRSTVPHTGQSTERRGPGAEQGKR